MKPLRIAMIGQKGIPARYGGVETHVENVATRLAARGHEVWTFCRTRFAPLHSGEPEPEGYQVLEGNHWYKGVRLAYRGSVNTKHLDAATHTLLCALESGLFHGFDIVHFHGIGPAAFAPIPRLFGRRVVSTLHALDWRQKKWGGLAKRALVRGERTGARSSHGVIAVSKIIQGYVAERYGVASTHIPNGAALPPAGFAGSVERWGLEPGGYVLTVGRIIQDRGLHHLIEAFRVIPGERRLVIVGSETPETDYTRRLREMADGRVLFTGDVFGEGLESLYANCAVYVLASEVEGLPITVCEAMAHGRALVLSDIPENREVAGNAAEYFTAHDTKGLQVSLTQMLEDEERRRISGVAGLERVRTTYNWDVITDQIQEFYARLVRR